MEKVSKNVCYPKIWSLVKFYCHSKYFCNNTTVAYANNCYFFVINLLVIINKHNMEAFYELYTETAFVYLFIG